MTKFKDFIQVTLLISLIIGIVVALLWPRDYGVDYRDDVIKSSSKPLIPNAMTGNVSGIINNSDFSYIDQYGLIRNEKLANSDPDAPLVGVVLINISGQRSNDYVYICIFNAYCNNTINNIHLGDRLSLEGYLAASSTVPASRSIDGIVHSTAIYNSCTVVKINNE